MFVYDVPFRTFERFSASSSASGFLMSRMSDIASLYFVCERKLLIKSFKLLLEWRILSSKFDICFNYQDIRNEKMRILDHRKYFHHRHNECLYSLDRLINVWNPEVDHVK